MAPKNVTVEDSPQSDPVFKNGNLVRLYLRDFMYVLINLIIG